MNPFSDLIPNKTQTSAFSNIGPTKKPSALQNFRQGAINIGKDIVGLQQNQSQSLLPQLIQSTIGSKGLAGIAQLPGRVIDAVLHPESTTITPGQALGTTLNAGLTAFSGGTGSVAGKLGLKELKP